MSYSIQIGSGGFEQIASNEGYADFGAWVESLDVEKYPDLIHLYEWGWCENLDDLKSQIDAAMRDDDPPKDKTVVETVSGIQQIIADRPADAVVATISAGLSDRDGDDEKSLKYSDDQPREEDGRFGSGGGTGEHAAPADSQLTGRGISLLEMPVHIEHAIAGKVKAASKAATDWLGSKTGMDAVAGGGSGIVGKLGHGVSVIGKLGVKASFAGWIAGQSAVEAVAKAKGLNAGDVARVKAICSCYDAIACKGVFLGLEHAGMHELAAASGFIPTASVAYLAYSAATNPVAVCKAASRAVKSAVAKLRGGKSIETESEDAVGLLADAIQRHSGDDWFFALLPEAMEVAGSMTEAIAIAEEAYKTKE
jgi:hypothetical protein